MFIKLIQITILITFSVKTCNNDPNCRRCIHNETVPVCDLCQYSYFNESTQTCDNKIPKISNCEVYKMDFDETICQKCQIGYFSKRDRCAPCPNNCGTCTDDGKTCEACLFSIMVQNNRCDLGDASIQCQDQNCYSCNTQNQCLVCNDGYALNDQNICVKSLSNCLKLQQNNNQKCDTCLYGYFITSNFKCAKNQEQKSTLFQVLMFIVIFSLILSPFLFVLYRRHKQMRTRQAEQEDREILIQQLFSPFWFFFKK